MTAEQAAAQTGAQAAEEAACGPWRILQRRLAAKTAVQAEARAARARAAEARAAEVRAAKARAADATAAQTMTVV